MTTFDSCPRALYFAYFPWGDEYQNRARFLRRAATVESLAGTIVHRHIAIGLRQLVKRGRYPMGLELQGAREYQDALVESKRIASIVRAKKRPPDEGTCLFHHLYGAEDEFADSKGLEIVQECLRNFETSSMLEFLKTTNFDRWEIILTNSDDIPSFDATTELGFTRAAGLRIYAAYDLALKIGDEFHVIDWKAGVRSMRSLSAVRRQLAVYGLWAMSTGVPAEHVRVQACWLQDDPGWAPQELDREDIDRVIAAVEELDDVERSITTPVADKNGVIVRYNADREAFKPRPEARTCGWCPYRSICAEGMAATNALALAS